MIYGVFSDYCGEYLIGYFNNSKDAYEYCNIHRDKYYYVKPLRDLSKEKDSLTIRMTEQVQKKRRKDNNETHISFIYNS